MTKHAVICSLTAYGPLSASFPNTRPMSIGLFYLYLQVNLTGLSVTGITQKSYVLHAALVADQLLRFPLLVVRTEFISRFMAKC